MAIQAGIIGLEISSRLQFRVFLVPWVRRSKILCSKGRDCSSSSPVRYVPIKSSKRTQSENSFPLKGFNKDELQRDSDAVSEFRITTKIRARDEKRSIIVEEKFQNPNRLAEKNLLFDGAGEEMSIEHLMEEPEEVVEEPKEVFQELEIYQLEDIREQKELQPDKTMLDVEKSAVKLLATRAFTAAELRKKLIGKKFPSSVVEAVIVDFRSRGFINDGLYAESFSRSRWSSSTWGPRRIKQALFNKGISEVDAEKAVKQVFRNCESGEDQESKVGMSKISMDHLLVQASKQWLRSHNTPKETRKTRIVRWLQYRGFSWGVISFILKRLESQYPP